MSKAGEERLSLVPLGVKYKEVVFDKDHSFQDNQSFQGIDLKVWEKRSFVSSKGDQEINVVILQQRVPLKNREPILFLSLPDRTVRKAYFPPTDTEGRTSLKLAPISAPNGTLITYRVCLLGLSGEELCVGESYMIWNYE
jgi:hypothetical protein